MQAGANPRGLAVGHASLRVAARVTEVMARLEVGSRGRTLRVARASSLPSGLAG